MEIQRLTHEIQWDDKPSHSKLPYSKYSDKKSSIKHNFIVLQRQHASYEPNDPTKQKRITFGFRVSLEKHFKQIENRKIFERLPSELD